MSDKLQQLSNCGHSWAEERARQALEIVQFRDAGQLTPAEAQELLQDLVATDKLEAVADNIAIKTALVEAVYVAAQFS